MVKGIITVAQERLGVDTTASVYGKPLHMLYLVLLNYKPISRIVNGVKEYLYVDIYDPKGSAYFMAERGFRHDKNGVRHPDVTGLLEDLLLLHARANDFMDELCTMTGNALEAGNSNKDGKVTFSSQETILVYQRRNVELQALLFATKEFEIFEHTVLQGVQSSRIGNYLLGDEMYLRAQKVDRSTWLGVCYNTYMFYRNIDLGDFYYTNQKKPCSEPFFRMNRVVVLDEYIPLAYKFTEITNPLLDNDFPITSVSKIFNKALVVEPLSVIGGTAFEVSRATKQTYGLFTTRLELAQIFGVSCSKYLTSQLIANGMLPIRLKKKYTDFFSPRYFWTILYTQLVQSTDFAVNFCLTPLESMVYVRHKPQEWTVEYDEAFQDLDDVGFRQILLNTTYRKNSQAARGGDSPDDREANFGTALVIEYMTKVFKVADNSAAWQRSATLADVTGDIIRE